MLWFEIKPLLHVKNHIFVECNVRKSDEVIEDLDEDVYCSIAVTKYMQYLGFNGVLINPEHPKLKPFTLTPYYSSSK